MKIKLLSSSVCYAFNFSIATIIMIFFGINKKYSLSAELGFVISIISTFFYFFSSNMKNVILTNSDVKLLLDVFLFRILSGVILVLLSYIIIYFFFSLQDLFLVILMLTLFFFSWVNEIFFSKFEIKNNYNFFYFYNLFFIIFFFVTFFLIHFDEIKLLKIFILFYLLLNITIYFLYLRNIKFFFKKNLFLIFKKNLFSYSFYSGCSGVLANFIWRICIFSLYPRDFCGILFTVFAIASSPGTVFLNSIAPSLFRMKKKIIIPNYIYYLFFLFILILIYNFFYRGENFFFKVLSISLVGTIFMIGGLIIRQKIFVINNFSKNLVFILDVLTSLLISLVVPIIFILNPDFIIYAYFISSLIIYAIFFVIKKKFFI